MSAATIHKLGPGQLTFGETGAPTEFGVKTSSVTLTPDVDDGDEITVLSGDTVMDDAAINWKLEGEIYQTFDKDSLLAWCNENNGKVMPFIFKPRSDQPLTCKGKATIRPLPIGGNVKERNTSKFEFKASDVTITTTGTTGNL